MISKSTIRHPDALLRVLSAQYKVLSESGSATDLLEDYSQLLAEIRNLRSASSRNSTSRAKTDASITDVSLLLTAGLDQLESLVNDETTSRRVLEALAVHRFSVPKGSMRKYSNKQLLVDKLSTLIQNERAHQTIKEIARTTGR